MAYKTGRGGVMTFAATQLPVVEWKLRRRNNVANVTNAKSTGGNRELITGPVNEYEGTATILWDSAATPESLGLVDGASGTLSLTVGAGAVSYSITAFFADFEVSVNTREGAVQYTMTWQGSGTLSGPS